MVTKRRTQTTACAKANQMYGGGAGNFSTTSSSIELSQSQKEAALLVTKGATVECTEGTKRAKLKSSGGGVKVGKVSALTINDTKLEAGNFVTCKKLTKAAEKKGKKGPVACKPQFESQWKGSDANTVIKNPDALHKLCTLKCKKANGKVTIFTSGQGGGVALAGISAFNFLIGDDIYQAFSGREAGTYRKLKMWERGLSIFNLIPQAKLVKVGGTAVKTGSKFLKVSKHGKYWNKAAKGVSLLAQRAKKGKKVVKGNAGELFKSIRKKGDDFFNFLRKKKSAKKATKAKQIQKQKVLDNINESKLARESSNFKQYAKKEKKIIEKASGVKVPKDYSQVRKYWKKDVDFKGTKVFQKDGIIDIKKVDVRGRSNLQRMEQGLAPLGPDGNPVNLHHMTQRDISSIAEVEQSFHQTNSKTIHINPNSVPSGIDRKSFNKWRSDYWKNRAKDFK